MSTEQPQYKGGDVVWVKHQGVWWPCQVQAPEDLPEDVLSDFKPNFLAIIKFFDGDFYEPIYNAKNIFPYNGNEKTDFLRKGFTKYQAKQKEGSSYMKEFPSAVSQAETLTEGDPKILEKEPFVTPQKATPAWKNVFVDPEEKAKASPKGRGRGRGRGRGGVLTPPPSQTSDEASSSPGGNGGAYKCTQCPFNSSRLNVFVLHQKGHADGTLPVTEPVTPVSASKGRGRGRGRSRGAKSASEPRKRKTRGSEEEEEEEQDEEEEDLFDKIRNSSSPSKPAAKKRKVAPKKEAKTANKKGRTKKDSATPTKPPNMEVKNKLMADWSEDEGDKEEEEMDYEQEEGGTEARGILHGTRSDDEEEDEEELPPAKDDKTELKETKEEATEENKEEKGDKTKEETEKMDFETIMSQTELPSIPTSIAEPNSAKTTTEGTAKEENDLEGLQKFIQDTEPRAEDKAKVTEPEETESKVKPAEPEETETNIKPAEPRETESKADEPAKVEEKKSIEEAPTQVEDKGTTETPKEDVPAPSEVPPSDSVKGEEEKKTEDQAAPEIETKSGNDFESKTSHPNETEEVAPKKESVTNGEESDEKQVGDTTQPDSTTVTLPPVNPEADTSQSEIIDSQNGQKKVQTNDTEAKMEVVEQTSTATVGGAALETPVEENKTVEDAKEKESTANAEPLAEATDSSQNDKQEVKDAKETQEALEEEKQGKNGPEESKDA